MVFYLFKYIKDFGCFVNFFGIFLLSFFKLLESKFSCCCDNLYFLGFFLEMIKFFLLFLNILNVYNLKEIF